MGNIRKEPRPRTSYHFYAGTCNTLQNNIILLEIYTLRDFEKMQIFHSQNLVVNIFWVNIYRYAEERSHARDLIADG